MAARLNSMKGTRSLDEFGRLAGVSAQAAMKWLNGGNVKDATLQRLVDSGPFCGRYTVEWIRYGDAIPSQQDASGLSLLAVDLAKRWMALSPDRQDWFRDLIYTMHFMESRFPAMRKGRPRGEHYAGFERAVEQDIRHQKTKADKK